ncbi:MAG: hypothetical protein JEZ00_15195 [Anaerolineaceae bacterium]|nr:hypothetical protein [Anaerolineaceae bacterium]
MASDYEAISMDNIRRRGEEFDDIGALLAEQLYSDQTHFVYELLQNAQDALKRRRIKEPSHTYPKSVHFDLYPNRLEMRHYGDTFTSADVKAISDILSGTKTSDTKQIGRFGIGFKSVYAFTEVPKIHSGDEHFSITRYIRPKAVPPVPLIPGETLFIFPFNHKNKKPEETYEQIRERLADLGLRTLLFLDEIDHIVWSFEGVRAGAYIRDRKKVEEDIWRISLLGEEGDKTSEEHWLVFQRYIVVQDTTVELAFKLGQDEKTKKEFIQPIEQSMLCAYFETGIETRLKFLIQGHYHTTPSRDNIKTDDDYNLELISETSRLLIDTLQKMKAMNMLSIKTLEAMPINEDHFPEKSIFRPFYESFLQAMKTMPFLPTANGKYITADEAKLARGSDLINLLSDEDLEALFGSEKNFYWLSEEITRDKTPALREYLMSELDIDEIDPEKFARVIHEDFLKEQPDEWFVKFYEFLSGQPALLSSPRIYSRKGILRTKPIIRTEQNTLMTPFGDDDLPQVFLPGLTESSFPIVKRKIAADEKAIGFLRGLGITEPEIFDEVMKFVLPKYCDGENVSDKNHIEDIQKIYQALDIPNSEKKK